jgi:hypothetical protein
VAEPGDPAAGDGVSAAHCDNLAHMGNGIELFWTLVCYAVVLGGAVLGGLVFYYWFVEIPRRELGGH